MSEHPPPDVRTEEVDVRRRYNITRMTQPELQHTKNANALGKTTGFTCTPRIIFWTAAGMVMPVWILSAMATVGESWLEDESYPPVVFDDDGLDTILGDDYHEAIAFFWRVFIGFLKMQIFAIILASVALVLLAVSLCCPASGWCCSAKIFGGFAACVLAASSFCQFLALYIITGLESPETDSEPLFDTLNDLGPSFWVGAASFFFTIIVAIILFAHVCWAGEGLIYEFTRKILTPEKRS